MKKSTIFLIMFIASIIWALIERYFEAGSIRDQVYLSCASFIGVCFSDVDWRKS